jgi:hypothetical protein
MPRRLIPTTLGNLVVSTATGICFLVLPSCGSVQEAAPLTVYADGNYLSLARCFTEKYDSGEDSDFRSVEAVPHDSQNMVRLKASTSAGWRTELWQLELSKYSETVTRIDARGTPTLVEGGWAQRALNEARACGATRAAP